MSREAGVMGTDFMTLRPFLGLMVSAWRCMICVSQSIMTALSLSSSRIPGLYRS
jgi:hypothetical protein